MAATYQNDEAPVHVVPYDPSWPSAFGVQPELLLIGEVGETLVGAVIAGFDGVRGWIYHLAVAPECRRRGFATQLMCAAEDGLRQARVLEGQPSGSCDESRGRRVLPERGV